MPRPTPPGRVIGEPPAFWRLLSPAGILYKTGKPSTPKHAIMAYELQGAVKAIMETQTFPSGFSKREFVVTTNDKYPQDVKFEVLKEKTAILDQFSAGSKVNVFFDIRGNEYQGKYYVNLQAWKVEPMASIGEVTKALDSDSGAAEEPPPGHFDEGFDDTVPF